jgi:hypothetical protein
MKFPLKAIFAATTLLAGTPAVAALTPIAGAECSISTPEPDADACAGAFAGNLLNNNDIGDINAALDILLDPGDFDPDAVWADLDPTKLLISGSGNDPDGTITFQQALLGQVILGIHFGDAGTGNGNNTIFYLFNFDTPTTTIDLGQQGFSDGIIINPPEVVPEPATWATMLLGFAAAGYALRRRRKSLLPQVA